MRNLEDGTETDNASAMEPLVLLPGLMCDSRIWTDQIEGLGPERDVFVGRYGLADSIEEMARRALEGLPAKFALAGHSMGGRVALELWRTVPTRITRLALLDTGIHTPGPSEPAKRHALLCLGLDRGIDALTEAWLPPMVAPRNRQDPLMRRLRAMVAEAGVETFAAQVTALLNRPEVESLLPSINVPTLVGVGSEDDWSPPEQVRAIAGKIPGAHFVVFQGAGHMAPSEAPASVTQAFREWLAA